MMLCLEDEDVTFKGGLPVAEYNKNEGVRYAVWDDTAFINVARAYCKTIVAISCNPNKYRNTLLEVCKAYIEAARLKNYQMMFVSKGPARYEVFQTKDGKAEFIKNPRKFIDSRGRDWFFCKCERGFTKECYGLKEYPKETTDLRRDLG